MTLDEKLKTINRPEFIAFDDGKEETIKDFYETFIEPRLPQNIEYVIKWHKVLKAYVKKENTVLGFRTGNTRGKLRRGWETITNDDYSFFYNDNFFAHFFFKLAFDADWEPNIDDFYNAMLTKSFPVRFTYFAETKDDPHAREYASFNIDGLNPGLNFAGYKLAHVIDAGQNYCIENQLYGMKKIIKTYFNIGNPSDWKKNPNTEKYSRTDFNIPKEKKVLARKIAEASFLRMIHPMNYFLSPKSPTKNRKGEKLIYNKYTIGTEDKFNIAEDKTLISYVRQKFHERYTVDGVDYFQEFLDLVYPIDDKINENGNTVINIQYSKLPLFKISSADIQNGQKPSTTTSRRKFQFNGNTYSLRDLALAVVNYYISQNPNITFNQLSKVFDLKLKSGGKPLIRNSKDVPQKDRIGKTPRVFSNNPIRLQNEVAYVNNQWCYNPDFSNFQQILNTLNYQVQEL